jgi:putative inorganic carbon (hco3(-)) transporter
MLPMAPAPFAPFGPAHTSASRPVSFLLLAYVALLPYQYAIQEPLRIGVADICLAMYLLLHAGSLRIRREAWSVWHNGMLLVFVMGLFVIAVRQGFVTQYEVLNKMAGLIALVAAYLALTTEVEDWWQFRKVLRVFVLGVCAQNLVALGALIASYVAGFQTTLLNYENERLSGMLYDPNAYGGLLVVALAFNVVGSSGPTPVTRGVLKHVCNLTLVMGIAFTFSRSAWLSLAAAWLTYVVFRPGSAVKMLAVVVLSVPAVLFMAGQGLVSTQRMVDRPETVHQRVDLMEHSLAQFREHPLVGLGLGGFRGEEGLIVHNTPLWFLADFGLIGMFVFCGFVAWFYLSGLRSYLAAAADAQPLVLAVIVSHSAMLGLSMGIEGFYQRHWWLCFGLIAAAARAVRTSPAGFSFAGSPALRSADGFVSGEPSLAACGRVHG